jgi:hypothetical protein
MNNYLGVSGWKVSQDSREFLNPSSWIIRKVAFYEIF